MMSSLLLLLALASSPFADSLAPDPFTSRRVAVQRGAAAAIALLGPGGARARDSLDSLLLDDPPERPEGPAARAERIASAQRDARFPSELAEDDAGVALEKRRAARILDERAPLTPEAALNFATFGGLAWALNLYLGFDWLLAPLGLENDFRPGDRATVALGRALAPA